MSEIELAARVIEHVREQGFDVYQEVSAGGGCAACDIVAKRGPLLWAIECKEKMGEAVLTQAAGWVGQAHLVSVATMPSPRGFSPVFHYFLKGNGVGWLEVRSGQVNDRIEASIHRRIRTDKGSLSTLLREEHKTYLAAGTAAAGRWTPFRDTCYRVAEAVRLSPGITLKELVAPGAYHYANRASATSGIAHWIGEGKIPGVRLEREGKKFRLYPTEVARS